MAQRFNLKNIKEGLNELIKDKPYLFFLSSALFLVLVISILMGSVFWEAYPALSNIGIIEFIFGTEWEGGKYGIWVFIMGTFYMTAVTMCMAIPLGILTAVYLSEFAHPKIRSVIKPSIELLVGIPSVVYGIFGLFMLKLYFRDYLYPFINGINLFMDSTIGFHIPFLSVPANSDGSSIFLASLVLMFMTIPTIISISEDAMRSVDRNFREGSLALGATKWETIEKIVIPTAIPGITTAITLAMTRSVGETMAIIMLIGNATHVPESIFDTGYAMTSKILNDIAETSNPLTLSALFGIAAVLFIIEAILISMARIINWRLKNIR